MHVKEAIKIIRTLGKETKKAYIEKLNKNWPKSSWSGDLLIGMASYHKLGLVGLDKKIDAAYIMSLAYLTEQTNLELNTLQ